MRSIRIGNDIVIDWTIIRNGRPEDFRAKSLSLFICHRYGRERVETFSIEGNKIRFAFWGKNQRHIGDYGLLLIVNDGSGGMFSVDLDNAFCLTQHTDCGCDGVIELMSDIALPANGLSAYELAVINGYEGTEQEWLESLVQPAKAAAAEALAAAERADSATETAMATNTAVQQAERLRVASEQERVSAESQRAKAESQRGTAESERAAAETDRTNAESKRELSETERKQAEETRIASEQTRTTAESSRVKAEESRQTAESARQAAEAKRQTDTAAAIKNAETATTEANNAAGKANVAANRAEEGAINLGIEDYPEFSVEKAYIAGDVVRYSGKLYRFTSAHPAGAWIGTDAEQTSVKEELDRAVAMKANVDGYYETMRVGTADNLTPRGESSEEIIMSRTAGGNNAVESGDALIKSIKGNSLVYSQLCNFAEVGADLIKADGCLISQELDAYRIELKIDSSSYNVRISTSTKIKAGHKYLFNVDVQSKKDFTLAFGLANNTFLKVSDAKNWKRISAISQQSSDFNYGRLWFGTNRGELLTGDIVYIKNTMYIDLTQMFGTGNEPTTAEEFAHRLGYDSIEQIPYLPYNEGEIVSCNAEGIRTTDAEGDTYERSWATTLHEYFPRGLQSVGNVYDEITPNKAIKRISNNREILQQPEEYPYDELNLSMRVSPGGKEEAIIPKGVLSTPLRMDVVYPIDAYGTIVNNRQRIGNLSSLQTQAKTDLVSAINELKEVLSTLSVNSESNERNITQLRADTDGIITDWGVDNRTLPLLCGQPMILFGHGAPAKGVVPDNWIQFDPVSGQGYDWNGTPSVLGQQYLDVDVSAGGFYIAARDKDMGLKWINC